MWIEPSLCEALNEILQHRDESGAPSCKSGGEDPMSLNMWEKGPESNLEGQGSPPGRTDTAAGS